MAIIHKQSEPDSETTLPDTTYSTPAEPTADEKAEAEKKRLEEYDKQTLKMVNEGEQKLREFESEWSIRHEAASTAKKRFEAAEEEFRDMIAMRREERGKKPVKNLFSDAKSPDIQLGQDDDAWKTYPLTFANWDRFGLTEKDIEKLNAGETKKHGSHPLLVLGAVTRFITPDPNSPGGYARTLKDIKGFGDAAVDRWASAEEQFWAWWKEQKTQVPAPELGPDPRGSAEPILKDVTSGQEEKPEVVPGAEPAKKRGKKKAE